MTEKNRDNGIEAQIDNAAYEANAGQSSEGSSDIRPVARGLAPVRLRSSRKPDACGVPGSTRVQVLGLLRSPTGASPLATGSPLACPFLNWLALAYEEWFIKQVQASLDDPRTSIPDKEGRRLMTEKREVFKRLPDR
jgi:hypothetical protein